MRTDILVISLATIGLVLVVVWGVRTLNYDRTPTPEPFIETTPTGDTASAELGIEVLTEGRGDRVTQKGDTIAVKYRGTLSDGQEFDSNYDGSPFTFTIGAGQVIAGWEQGLLNMKVGEKRHLTIPPHLGYGDREIPGRIPAQSTLIFEVELINIEDR